MNELVLGSIIFIIAQVFTQKLIRYYKITIERLDIVVCCDFVRIVDDMYLHVHPMHVIHDLYIVVPTLQ